MKLANFCVLWVDFCLSQLGVGGLCGFIGKELLCRVLCIMLSSFWYSCWFRLLELSLLYRYLTVAYLRCVGWLDGMMMSLNVGFLNMAAFRLVGVLFFDSSR